MSTLSDLAPGQLVSRTTRIPPTRLLELLPDDGAVAWVRRGEGLVGYGPALRVELPSATALTEAGDLWRSLTGHAAVRDDVNLPGTGPVAFVSFPFSRDSAAGGVLLVPSVVLGRRGEDCWVTSTAWSSALPTPVTPLPVAAPPAPGEIELGVGSLSRDTWRARVSEAVQRIAAGDVDKVVLARDVTVNAEQPIDERWLARRLADAYPTCWTFAVDGLVGATPELLVRSERGLVTSRVLAGTIPRTGDEQRDLARAATLAKSSKDLEEHEYAVRSVADALAPHCDSMNVPESPFVLHLPNVMHLATDVAGVLHRRPESSAGQTVGAVARPSVLDLGASLHPSAAVCGTPTSSAAALIGELENMDRDRYAGPVGWVDADGDGELGIALRCGRLGADPRTMRVFAGCGIVAGSDPEAELAESTAKMEPMRHALQGD